MTGNYNMNKLSFLTRILLYAVFNPKKGRQLLETKYQSLHDQKHTNMVYSYDKKLTLEEIIIDIFPDMTSSIIEIKQNTEQIQNHIKDFFELLKSETYPSKKKPYPIDYTLDNNSGLFLYTLCKIIKPEHVVETGVAYGLSSVYVLQALHENKKGTLHSIDSVFSPWQSKDMIGSAIPSHLRHQWNLVFGTSSDKLKTTLESLKSVDVFFHDSLHTYKNMMFEFRTSWPFIKNNGFLISDDISDNSAFYEFCTEMKTKPLALQQKENSFLGITHKI